MPNEFISNIKNFVNKKQTVEWMFQEQNLQGTRGTMQADNLELWWGGNNNLEIFIGRASWPTNSIHSCYLIYTQIINITF